MPKNKRMARPRDRRYRDLPDNLTYDSARGLYRYRNPITKRRTYLNSNKAECIKSAKKLNAQLMPADSDLLARVTGAGQTWTMAVYRYEQDIAPDKEWSEKTRSQYTTYFRKLRQCRIGAMALADIQVLHVNEALDRLTTGKRMRNVYRHLMVQIFAYGQNLGWCHDNPAEITLKVAEKRQRMRMTIEGYRAIREAADPWLKVAMDLSLITLQRPEDLVVARYDDIQDGRLHIQQQKSIRAGIVQTKLRIAIGPELQSVIDASRDGKLCPYIIHRKPIRSRKSKLKSHPMQLSVDQLGKEFAAARAACGYYANATSPPPTYYEIKSLGGDRYRSAGWRENAIQSLYGHEDIDTTEHYLEGHEPPWEDVDCGLSR